MLDIIQIPVLKDNYIYLLHDSASDETAVVDPAEANPVLRILAEKNWTLNYIFNTHHHWDHVGGNLLLKERTGCGVIASSYDQNRIPGIDQAVSEGDMLRLGDEVIEVINTPGHTLGHIVYFCRQQHALFCGDTLFSLGCGRLFEGTPEQMWHSWQKIRALPDETKIYCAHEYTENNARFALSVDPDNIALKRYNETIHRLRAQNKSTIPTTLAQEKACNPFLRPESAAIRQILNMPENKNVDVFARLRQMKDHF